MFQIRGGGAEENDVNHSKFLTVVEIHIISISEEKLF